MDRLLLLMCAPSWEDARETIGEAVQRASVPQRLTVGLLLQGEMDEAQRAQARGVRGLNVLSGKEDGIRAFGRFWQGENTVLVVSCDVRFPAQWDTQLLALLREAGEHTALTGFLPWEGDPVDAACAVCATGLEAGKLHFGQGIPMRYASLSHQSAFLNSDFLFAPAAFLQELQAGEDPDFLTAFRKRWKLCTSRLPVLHAQARHVPGDADLTHLTEEGREALADFCAHFGIDWETGTLSPGLREGIFTPDLQVKSKVPLTVRLQEGVRRTLLSASAPDVLCVTSCPDRPEAEKPDALEMARFRRLAGIDSLRLLCFATPECIRTVLFSHPNTLAWKTEHDMPLHGNGSAEDNRRFSVLNRFFLLARAQEKSMDHTHYAWMDFAYLRYPVYEGATLHWDAIAGQKICIGTCEGKMDLSMIVVPAGEVLPLTREISAMCEKHWKEKGCLPEPEDVLWTLAERSSGRFDFVPIPTRGDLFSLTMTLFGEEWGIKRK